METGEPTSPTARGTSTEAPIADALVLTFTAGMSLGEWEKIGLLPREMTLYQRLAPCYGRLLFVTYGGAQECELAKRCGVEVVCNAGGLDAAAYLAAVPRLVAEALSGAGTAVVKTNQMQGGRLASRIRDELAARGTRAALIARGGYLWSQFVARAEGSHGPSAREAGAEESELCRSADVVIGTTAHMVDDLGWRYGIEPPALVTIPNFVPTDVPVAGPDQREKHTILYAGQLVRRKRVDLLIQAVSMLSDEVREGLVLSIIGAGPEKDALQQLASDLQITAKFESRIPHPELMARMGSCTIYAQASEYEGHPKTIIEAMACGCPVVVADAPGVGGIVEHGLTGLRFPHAPEHFARGFEGLLSDEGWREALGMAASRSARDRYGIEQVVEQEKAAHRLALERRGRSAGVPFAPVRWDPGLLGDPINTQVLAWERSLRGFANRMEPRKRAQFLMAFDQPMYVLQGEAAIAADGGLHPKHRLMGYHDFFVERLASGGRVIDLGCGVGALAASIAQRSPATVVGMDWSEPTLAKARERASTLGLGERLSFVHGDITSARAPGTFDTVVLSNVLEHIADRPVRLRQWIQWYTPTRFLIRVPAFDREWRAPWKRELGVEWRLDDTHEIEYTEQTLRDELAQAGLDVGELIARWGEYWLEARVADAGKQSQAA